MKTTKTLVLVSLLVCGMTTSVFASWWNPLTWNLFKKNNVVSRVQQVSIPVVPNVQNQVSSQTTAPEEPKETPQPKKSNPVGKNQAKTSVVAKAPQINPVATSAGSPAPTEKPVSVSSDSVTPVQNVLVNDICKNIEGVQTKVPEGMFMGSDGICFTPSVQSSNQASPPTYIVPVYTQPTPVVKEISVQENWAQPRNGKFTRNIQVYIVSDHKIQPYEDVTFTYDGQSILVPKSAGMGTALFFDATGTKDITIETAGMTKTISVDVQ